MNYNPPPGHEKLDRSARNYGYHSGPNGAEFVQTFDPLRWDCVEPVLDGAWLVKGVIPMNALCAVYGPPGCGKSFFTSGMSLSIALNEKWNGKPVETGGVLYVAAEGSTGMKNRISAYRMRNEAPATGVPFFIYSQAVNLRQFKERKALIEWVEDIAHQGEPISMIIFDTFSRCIGGGDENNPKDMGAAIAGADEIRVKTNSTVLLVHHSGKDIERGMRGHNSLLGATDTVIQIKKEEGYSVAKVEKQKDGPDGEKFFFKLQPVTLGYDADDDEVTSCVVNYMTEDEVTSLAEANLGRLGLSGNKLTAWRELVDTLNDVGELVEPDSPLSGTCPELVRVVRVAVWRDRTFKRSFGNPDKPDNQDRAFRRAMQDLQNAGYLRVSGEYVWRIKS